MMFPYFNEQIFFGNHQRRDHIDPFLIKYNLRQIEVHDTEKVNKFRINPLFSKEIHTI